MNKTKKMSSFGITTSLSNTCEKTVVAWPTSGKINKYKFHLKASL